MLNLPRNAAGDIQFGLYRTARQADLAAVFNPAAVHRCARSGHRAAQAFGQFFQQSKAFRLAQAAPAGHNNVRFGQIQPFAFAFDKLQKFGQRGKLPAVKSKFNYFTRTARFFGGLGVRHGTQGAHFRPRVGAGNGGHEVAAEGRARGVQLPVLFMNHHFGGVGRQARPRQNGRLGRKGAAHIRGGQQKFIGFILRNHGRERLGIDVVHIIFQLGRVAHINDIGPVLKHIPRKFFHLFAEQHRAKFFAQIVGQFAAGV